ncbi:hypothetical protein [Thalassospira marina]|uniref:Solute-binding protein family 3/N-terminal domain-containing protein n=1 Tax=Thalassospira marina TaxID=2048283 RepID=A0A2N3KGF7_9PROT|nr:hypothetical protein [Thalassospira marina]PKR49658.1 hypothetical protein COO20_21745 [Thalassospira marina]
MKRPVISPLPSICLRACMRALRMIQRMIQRMTPAAVHAMPILAMAMVSGVAFTALSPPMAQAANDATQNRENLPVARLPVDAKTPFCQGKQSWEDFREYHVELLRLAQSYSDKSFALLPVCMDYPTEKRRIAMLQTGEETNIVYFGTSPEREKNLLAVHFPIYLGTTGLRLFLTRPDISARLDQVQNLADLRQFTFGQGLGWPDSTILQQNGLAVIEGRYLTLHSMLALDRFDLYPRAYWQIQGEYDWMHQSEPTLVINHKVALYYPQPIYFFVSPEYQQLHDAILRGLIRAWQDGAVMALLRQNYETAPSFGQINPSDLRLVSLPNVYQSQETMQALRQYGLIADAKPEGIKANITGFSAFQAQQNTPGSTSENGPLPPAEHSPPQ